MTQCDLSRVVWTILPPQVTMLSSWLIPAQNILIMTGVDIWWYLNGAEVFHYPFYNLIERWESPASTLSDLPRGVWTIMLPPNHHGSVLARFSSKMEDNDYNRSTGVLHCCRVVS